MLYVSQKLDLHLIVKLQSYIIRKRVGLCLKFLFMFNMFHTRALNYDIYRKRMHFGEIYFNKFANRQQVSVVLVAIIRVSQRLLIKCTINC